MKNANKSAYPVDKQTNDEIEEGFWHVHGYGLTKRERFAMAAMQGFLSAGQTDTPNYQGAMRYKGLAKESIRYADELFKELEETNE